MPDLYNEVESEHFQENNVRDEVWVNVLNNIKKMSYLKDHEKYPK